MAAESTTRRIVDNVSGWLRVFDDGSVDRTWTGAPECQFLTTPTPATNEFIDGVATHDIAVGSSSGFSYRIYMPQKKSEDEEKLPLLIHFHGGGFCVSQAAWYMYHQFYTKLVRSVRAVCLAVEMRQAPEHRLPAACDDCYSGLIWVRDVASGTISEPLVGDRVDFKRVFLIGESAGGTLVHDVAARVGRLHAAELEPVRLAGGVILHPGFIRAERSKSELELQSESAFLTLDMVDKFLALALPLGSTKNHPITCPMGPEAPPLAGLRLPPMLVTVADRDLMRDTQLEYVEEMKKAGKDVQLVVHEGVGHCFQLNKLAVDSDPHIRAHTENLIYMISAFINGH